MQNLAKSKTFYSSGSSTVSDEKKKKKTTAKNPQYISNASRSKQSMHGPSPGWHGLKFLLVRPDLVIIQLASARIDINLI